jgi:uncharacterized protein YukE
MAKDLIKVSTAEMEAAIAKYNAEKAKLMGAFSICTKATSLIARSWAGPSFAVTSAKMAATWKNLFDTERKINDAIDELKKTIGIFDEAENSNKSNFAGLEVGTSPFE